MNEIGDIEIETDAAGDVIAVWVLRWTVDPRSGEVSSTRIAKLSASSTRIAKLTTREAF